MSDKNLTHVDRLANLKTHDLRQDIRDVEVAASRFVQFATINDYPEMGSPEFNELTRLVDALDTAVRARLGVRGSWKAWLAANPEEPDE